MRYRTLVLFILMFASAVGAALVGTLYDNLFMVFLFIAFPIFSALMFTSIVYDIVHPRPPVWLAKPAAHKVPPKQQRAPAVAMHTRAASTV